MTHQVCVNNFYRHWKFTVVTMFLNKIQQESLCILTHCLSAKLSLTELHLLETSSDSKLQKFKFFFAVSLNSVC